LLAVGIHAFSALLTVFQFLLPACYDSVVWCWLSDS
jgi:hypothetical protein